MRKMAELEEMLIGPVRRTMAAWLEVSRPTDWVFVPHAGLHLLPLHLMPAIQKPARNRRKDGDCEWDQNADSDQDLRRNRGKDRLIMDDYIVTYLPSLTIGSLNPLDSSPPVHRFVGISNPTCDLPWSDREVSHIAAGMQEWETVILSGTNAHPRAVETEVRTAGIIHFACHARFNLTDPMASFLALAGGDDHSDPDPVLSTVCNPPTSSSLVSNLPVSNGPESSRLISQTIPSRPYYLTDILMHLKLESHPLVVLSCCESGLSTESDSADEFVSFALGFLGSGARTVLSSHWTVDDQATYELMTRFYRRIVQETMSPARALQAAQQDLRRIPAWSNPCFWSAFRIHGVG
ncbi:CHAT domain-containing protein, partial [bacterium]|nr:CHAT domain-containing protein [candidate division CSSED10-310 bacterium]